jgi:hypothetical protein
MMIDTIVESGSEEVPASIQGQLKKPWIKPKKPAFRSKLEKRIARQLKRAGVKWTYESTKIPYIKNGKISHYHPDFHVNRRFHLEAKGYFVGGARDRHKLLLVKAQHPDLDLRIVFEREGHLVSPYSSMTYADWAEENGIPWGGGGKVPEEWLEEARCPIQ